MIRIIIREQFLGPEGQSYGTEYKTFDAEIPEVEKYLTSKSGGYSSRWVQGIEVLPILKKDEEEQ